MGNEELNTIPEKESDEFIKSSVEDLFLIPNEFEDTSGSDSECILPSCDYFSPINVLEERFVTFSNPLFNSNDDFISSDDESLSDEGVPEDNVFENIESKDSYDPNLDEPDLLITPLSDANKDECFDSGGDVDKINDFKDGYYDSEGDILYLKSLLNDDLVHHDPSIPAMSVASILEGFTNEPPIEENDDLFDLESKNNDWKNILYDAQIDDLMIEDKIFDLGIHYQFFLQHIGLISSESEDTIFDPGKMRIEQYFLMTDYSLWEVILNGDSPAPTRVADGVLQPVAPTTAEQSSENLDQIHDRLQKLISQLEIHGVSLSQEDVNLKFLGSLPSEWRTHTFIWRNKTDLEEHSLDDLFNSLKIYGVEVKSSSFASTLTQNIVFVSSSNTDSTNEPVSAVASVSTVSAKMPVSSLPHVDSLSNVVIYSIFASQSSMRVRRFLQRTGRNLRANEPTFMGFDMSKVECNNCHMKGHFSRKCRSLKDIRQNDAVEPQRRNVPVEKSTSNALVSQCDGRLLVYQQNESVFEDDIKLLKLKVQLRDNALVSLRQTLEKAEQERDDLKLRLEKFQTSSKNLTELLASQTNAKTGLGYNSQVFTGVMFDCDDYRSLGSDESLPLVLFMICINQALVLTQSKPVPITAVRPVKTVVPKLKVTRPTQYKPIVTKLNSPTRRHINRSPSPKASNSPPRVTAVKAPRVNAAKGMQGKWEWKPTCLILDHVSRNTSASMTLKRFDYNDALGRSKYMKGNMSYLSDFEELNCEYVAFRGNPKGGKISGKGKIRTGKLDFDDVYFVKELKFNLFSVSQMCDKKNSVLFTDTECLVLSPDFKLPDENQNNDGDAAFDEKEPKFDEKKPESEVNVSPSSISPIPTTKVHTDYPVTQIIGDLSSATQTRSMTRVAKDQGGLSQINNEDFHTCMNKKDERGIVVMNKARLVGQGHTHEEGIYYEEVFTPVARIKAIRLFLAYAFLLGFMMYQMDVKSAFLYGTIEEEVYVCQPTGFEDPGHLDKIYVDNIIFGLINKDLCKAFEKLMKEKFQMSLIGKLTFFLGLQVKQKKDGIFISQDKYVAEILRKFGLTDRKSASTPIDTEKPLLKDPDGEDVDVHTYRSMIGSLMYLTLSRLGIMFTVRACYLKDSPFDLVAYLDSDYAGTSLDRKSTTGGGVNTPRCDEDRLELMELTVFLLPKVKKVKVGVTVVDLQVFAIRLMLLLLVQKFLLFGLTNWCCSLSAVRSSIKYTLTVNANIYVSCIKQFWTTVVKKVNDITRLLALVDKKKVIVTKATIRDALRLDDAEGVECLPNEVIFVELSRMGYEKPSTKLTFYKGFFSSQWKFLIHTILQCISAKRTSWNEFNSSMTSAVICLSSGRKFNFSKYIFDSLVRNVDSPTKFYMYPCFLQLMIRKQVGNLSTHTTKYTSPALTQKVFANIRRVGKGFSRVETQLFEGMIVEQHVDEGDADEVHGKDVNAAKRDVSTANEEPSIPSPIPPTPPPQPSHDIPSTSQGRMIADMDADVDVVFEEAKEVADDAKDGQHVDVQVSVDIQGRTAKSQAKIYKIDLDHANMVLSMQEKESKPAKLQEVVNIVTTGKIITKVVTAASTTITAAECPKLIQFTCKTPALLKNKANKVPIPVATTVAASTLTAAPSKRSKGVVIRDPEESTTTTSTIIHSKTKPKDKDYFKGMSYDDIRHIFEVKFNTNVTFLQKTKEQIDEEESKALKRIIKTPAEKAAKRKKLDKEVEELKRHLQIVSNEEDDVYTEATPLTRKVPVVDYEIINQNNKPYYKIKRANGSHQLYLSFLSLLRNFDREDLEALWSLVKE
nr:ribonuclease H-like domain, reverse transcriptase, RNA-dependent DNA polymerase [Tanacetum cinerariifolium]